MSRRSRCHGLSSDVRQRAVRPRLPEEAAAASHQAVHGPRRPQHSRDQPGPTEPDRR